MVPNGYMSVNEAKEEARNELRTANKNYLNSVETDPVLQTTAPLRELLQMRINSNTYFKPEERRRRYKEVEYDPYNDNYPNIPPMAKVGPNYVSHANTSPVAKVNSNYLNAKPSKVGGRKTRKNKTRKHKSRKNKSRKH